MPRSYLGRRFDRILGAIVSGGGARPRRERMGRFLGVESLEPRALLATINASGVISSTPGTGVYNYTIALTNSSSSNSGIGTFWFAWVPGQDFLATNPISVTPPAGWTDQVSHTNGAADGYAIEFTAVNSSDYVQPGGSLDFSFTSVDTPASVEGNSPFYPTAAVGTSTVYPGVAGSDAGHQFVVTAAPTLASIAVTPVNPSVPKGESEQFAATGTFSNGSTEDVTSQVAWSSSSTSVASISTAVGSQGLATGLGLGSSTIVATLDGIVGQAALTVSPAVLESFAVTPANPFISIGDTEQFSAIGTFSDNSTQNLTSSVSWASSATSVTAISNASGSKGVATGVTKGIATISAALDGITGTAVLSVTPALESIAIAQSNPTLPKGEIGGFTATALFADNSTMNITSDATWASANTATATISNAVGSIGRASALAIGSSSISATFEGVTASTSLTVSPAVLTSISVSAASPNINQGSTDQFTASGLYSDNSTQDLTGLVAWTSATPSVATISSAGLASGIAPGNSTISASYQGISGSTALAVSPPLVTLTSAQPVIKRHKVTKVVLTFSGSLEADLAQEQSLYRFVIAGRKGLFTAKNAMVVTVGKAQYNPTLSPDTVTLIPRTAFSLSKPVEVRINGSVLTDRLGRLIDGNQDGQPGGEATAVLG